MLCVSCVGVGWKKTTRTCKFYCDSRTSKTLAFPLLRLSNFKLDIGFLCAFLCSWQTPVFDQDQIRLLVFNECDSKGRKLLFDSKAIKKNEEKAEVRTGDKADRVMA